MQMAIDEQRLRPVIAANVLRLRKQRALSQTELAAMAGISRVQLSRVENAHHTPGADVLYSLADALKVTADELRQLSKAVIVNFEAIDFPANQQ